jgi:hypothetical protein
VKKCYFTIVFLFLLLIASTILYSELPRTISFQGILKNSEGNIVPDGNYSGTFTIYNSETDGDALWNESKEFTIQDGVFNVILGETEPISSNLDFNDPYWLGIIIEDDPELSPRIAFTSVPYSLNSFSTSNVPDELVVKSLNDLRGHLNLIEGNNVDISVSGKDITISSSAGVPAAANTLDDAYDEGGNGAGRIIDADAGAVEIEGDDGLKVTGTNRVIEAYSTSGSVNAIWAESNESGAGIYAVSQGDESDGSAGEFHTFNSSNDSPTIYSETNGSGPAIKAIAKPFFGGSGGSGSAAIFGIETWDNTQTTLTSYHLGYGSAGYFYLLEGDNLSNALNVSTVGGGSAGDFIVNNTGNIKPAVIGMTVGSGEKSFGVFGISGAEPTSFPPFNIAGVGGVSIDQWGSVGYSEEQSGVYGQTRKTGTFSRGIAAIRAGVQGDSRADLSTIDNFGVAGIGYGYGTGVLGVGSIEGSGVLGVSGTSNTETNAAIRGITREGADGNATWPPYFPLKESPPYGKGKNGVIGQSVSRVGVWGESINKIGVVGNAGRRMGYQNLPGVVSGVAGIGYEDDSYGVYGTSESGVAGRFEIFESENHNPAIQSVSQGGYAAYFSANNSSYTDFAVNIETNTAGGLYVNSTEHGVAGMFEVSSSTSWGKVLDVFNRGLGATARIISYSQANDEVALLVSNFGLDKSLDVRSWNPDCDREALYLEQYGDAKAANIYQINSNSAETALYVRHYGIGRVARFYTDNLNNTNTTLSAVNDGNGRAGFFGTGIDNSAHSIYAYNEGTGRGIEILLDNSDNSNNALHVTNYGTGRVGEFDLRSTTSTAEALFAENEGLGRAGNFQIDNTANNEVSVFSHTIGTYRSASLQIDNTSNSSPSVFAYTNGLGEAGYFKVENTSNNSWALYVLTDGSSNRAGRFAGHVAVTGNLNINGTLSKGGGSFHIDHPLDPENKYLDHSFVESPDMKNIYDGTVVLDENGIAVVELPEWFEALNSDFRYQLTAIGLPSPNLHIAKEIRNNSFEIAGGHPGMKVSWQVTGIRIDKWAENNRIKTEYDKQGNERGRYLHYKEYGQPFSNSIEALQHKDLKPDEPKDSEPATIDNDSIIDEK